MKTESKKVDYSSRQENSQELYNAEIAGSERLRALILTGMLGL